MAQDEAIRWVPIEGLPELPLGALDLAYTASENRLTVSAYYGDSTDRFPQFEPSAAGVIVEFTNAHAFKAYEEFTDLLYAENVEVPLLAEKVSYGGTWGFIQLLGSSWLERLADRNLRWAGSPASHWVVKAGDMVLHVATDPSAPPHFGGVDFAEGGCRLGSARH